MCGIALVLGSDADPAVFDRMIDSLAARGESRETHRLPGAIRWNLQPVLTRALRRR